MQTPRRIVIGEDEKGRSAVLFDAPATNTLIDRIAQLWVTRETPANCADKSDQSLGPIEMNPPKRGSIFRYIELPPETPDADLTKEKEVLAEVSSGSETHATMHKTRSVDYVVLLAGEAVLVVDDTEIPVKPFDVVVQLGASHAWANRGTEPLRLLAVMLDAEPA